MSTEAAKKMPGTAKLDTPWEDLGFAFRPTNSHVKLTWKEGEGWSKPELVEVGIESPYHPSYSFDCALAYPLTNIASSSQLLICHLFR